MQVTCSNYISLVFVVTRDLQYCDLGNGQTRDKGNNSPTLDETYRISLYTYEEKRLFMFLILLQKCQVAQSNYKRDTAREVRPWTGHGHLFKSLARVRQTCTNVGTYQSISKKILRVKIRKGLVEITQHMDETVQLNMGLTIYRPIYLCIYPLIFTSSFHYLPSPTSNLPTTFLIPQLRPPPFRPPH